MPTDFIRKTVGPLNKYKDPQMADCSLDKFRVAMTTMNFTTGKVDSKRRRLLRLADARDIQSAVFAAKPWIGCDGVVSFDDFQPESYITSNPNPRNYYRTAEEFATTLNVWATNSASQTFKGSLLGQTNWREHLFV